MSRTATGSDTATASPTVALPSCDDPTALTKSDVESGGTISAGCYRADGILEIESGTLTLEAGVVIRFTSNKGIRIGAEGRLRTKGSESKPVVLTGTEESRGYWKGLFFDRSQSTDNFLEKTLIQYAGGGSWNPNWKNGAISSIKSTLALDGVTLRENARYALRVRKLADELSVSNTTFESNDLPAWVHASVADALGPDNAFVDNDTNAIRLGSDGTDRITAETTLRNPGIPFHVTKHIELEAPVRVAPGVTFKFDQGKGLSVLQGGELAAKGTVDDTVRFTGRAEVRGAWKGLRYESARSADNVLEYVEVEYGGDSAWNPNHSPTGIFLRGETPRLTVRDSTIRGHESMGLTATAAKADLTIDSCSFEANAAPLLVPANLVGGIAPTNSFTRNDASYVFVGDPGFGGVGTTVLEPATWSYQGVPYRPTVNVFVEAPLTVEPGTQFEFEQDKGMRVRGDGRLSAEATADEPIEFSGTEAISGFWRGLSFSNSLSADNVLRNVIIEYGGSSEWVGGAKPDVANLMVAGGDKAAAVTISDSTLRESGKFGIAIGNGEARIMDCSGLTFENNADQATINLETKEPISSCS